MASLLSNLAALIAGPAKPAAAKPAQAAPPKPKSPERIANEQAILAARRQILASMAEAERKSGTKMPVEALIGNLLLAKRAKP